MKEDYLKIVLEAYEKVTHKKVQNVDLNGELKDQLSIDSIQVVELFAELEDRLQVELPLHLMNVNSAQQFMDILYETIKQKSVSY